MRCSIASLIFHLDERRKSGCVYLGRIYALFFCEDTVESPPSSFGFYLLPLRAIEELHFFVSDRSCLFVLREVDRDSEIKGTVESRTASYLSRLSKDSKRSKFIIGAGTVSTRDFREIGFVTYRINPEGMQRDDKRKKEKKTSHESIGFLLTTALDKNCVDF